MILAIMVMALLGIVAFPAEAFAWGPGTHLEFARAILSEPALLPAAIRAIITKYPHDFYYGNISADIVVGKNLVEELKHCHNWSFGFKLLKRSKSESQRAFSYGYICHLAADTVAHNNFIPEMMVRSYSGRIHRHIYWELRFDALADKSIWKLPDEISKDIHIDNDSLLKATLEGTPLSFKTNKRIFTGVLNLHKVDHWHNMLRVLSKNSAYTLDMETKKRFFDYAVESIRDVLTGGKDARCIKKDPKGLANLAQAREAKKRLKSLKKKRGTLKAELEELLDRELSRFTY